MLELLTEFDEVEVERADMFDDRVGELSRS